MFKKIRVTNFPPSDKPVMIWDGHCGFCKYWVTRWKAMTGNSIVYKTFQDAAAEFPDIPLKEFKKASRLIEPDGRIYSGPDSAYRSYDYASERDYPFHRWYTNYGLFRSFSDHTYNFIAKNRPVMFRITKILFGDDPLNFKPYWAFYIFLLIALFYLL